MERRVEAEQVIARLTSVTDQQLLLTLSTPAHDTLHILHSHPFGLHNLYHTPHTTQTMPTTIVS